MTESISKLPTNYVNFLIPKFNNTLDSDNFISEYTNTYTELSGGHPEFKFCCSIVPLAEVTRRKAFMKFNFGTIYTNVNIFILGASSISGKSTSISEIKPMITDVCGIGTLPTMFSKEAIPIALSKNPNQVLLVDEAGGLLEKTNQKGGYMAGFEDDFCQYYDCPPKFVKKTTKEEITVDFPFVSSIFATTKERFVQTVTDAELDGGFFARFLFASDTSELIKIPAGPMQLEYDQKIAALKNHLQRINDIYEYVEEMEFTFSDQVFKEYNEWDSQYTPKLIEDPVLLMVQARMRIYLFKLSALFYIGSTEFLDKVQDELKNSIGSRKMCFGNSIDSPSIKMEIPDKYYHCAFDMITNWFIPTSINVYEDVKNHCAESPMTKIIKALKKAPNKTLSKSELHLKISGRITSEELYSLLLDLEGEEIISISEVGISKRRNKMVITLLDDKF